jgi:hypothetical protein
MLENSVAHALSIADLRLNVFFQMLHVILYEPGKSSFEIKFC